MHLFYKLFSDFRTMQRLMPHLRSKLFASLSASTRIVPAFQYRGFSAKVTQKAPDFAGTAVVDGQFKEIELRNYLGKYLVLFFYPLDFTFVCPTELIAFSDRIDEFIRIGCSIVGVSTDSHFSHLSWINTPRKVSTFTVTKLTFTFINLVFDRRYLVSLGRRVGRFKVSPFSRLQKGDIAGI